MFCERGFFAFRDYFRVFNDVRNERAKTVGLREAGGGDCREKLLEDEDEKKAGEGQLFNATEMEDARGGVTDYQKQTHRQPLNYSCAREARN